MATRLNLRAFTVLFLVVGASTSARAQESEGVGTLNRVLTVGQTLTVIDADGVRLRGRLSRLSPDAIVITQSGRPVAVLASRIQEVRRCCDPVMNGVLIGGVGLGVFGFATGLKFSGEVRAGDGVAGFLMFGAIGAAIGGGLDALQRSDVVVYRAPQGAIAVAPVPGGATARLLLRF